MACLYDLNVATGKLAGNPKVTKIQAMVGSMDDQQQYTGNLCSKTKERMLFCSIGFHLSAYG